MNTRQRFLKSFFVMFFIIGLSVLALDETNPAVFEYNMENNHVVITGLVKEPKDIVIPLIINEMPVTAIGDRAFYNCQNITTITIPESITSIGDDAMAGCKSLEAIFVDENNPYYATADGMLFDKDKSTLIAYPSGKKDEYVAIPDGVTSINGNAFSNCTYIQCISLPNSCILLNNCFTSCRNLIAVIADASNPHYTSRDGVLYDINMKELILYPAGKSEERYFILNGTEAIKDHAFANADKLTKVILPTSIKNIGEDAFIGCAALKELEFLGKSPSFHMVAGNIKCFDAPVTFSVGQDNGWENLEFSGVTLTFRSKLQQILELQKGWNLCALIITPDEESVNLLKSTSPLWFWYNSRFTQLDNPMPGHGFWIYAHQNTTLTLTGDKAYPASMRPGWNLIGAVDDINAEDLPDNFTVWGYDQRSYIRVHGGLKQGNAYWIFNYPQPMPQINYLLQPTDGMWRIDGSEWLASGESANVKAGVHGITFKEVIGYMTPPSQVVNVSDGQILVKTVSYAQIQPKVTYTLNPTEGKWRLDDGEWNASGAIVTTTVGDHTVSFQDVEGYTTPDAQTITLAAGDLLSEAVTYEAIPPTVIYTLIPADGKWRIDNGDWNASGATVETTVGEHTVSFQTVEGYTTLENQTITLAAGERLSQSITYEALPPTVTYVLNPTDGKWRIDNGEWIDSDSTVETTVGQHKITFQSVKGYSTPSSQNITLAAGEKLSKAVDYKPIQPTVTYTLTPTSGKWRIDDGEWTSSGKTLTTTVGEHTISFQSVQNYTTPSNQIITLTLGDKFSQTVAYEVILPKVTYTLNPAEGKWRIDGGDWNDSGATVEATVGSHKVSFMEVEGYNTPSEQTLFLSAGGMVERIVNYTVIAPTVSYTLDPENGKWRLDNGSWNNSGATVTTTVGNHTISFTAVDGYMTPDSQNIVLSAGENLSGTVAYETIQPTVTYTLSPSNGKWRLDNGVWNTSDTTVTTTVGTHSVSFQAVNNYITPAKQDITLTAGERLNKTVTYEPVPPTVTYTLNPSSGRWRIDDGDWNASGATVETTVGDHTISFMDILGYLAPDEQNISLNAGETYHNSKDYEKHETLYVVVDLSSGPDADNYPVRGTDTPPDLNDDTCRTTELWLRWIPAGTFMMGATSGEIGICSSETQHQVTITQDFYIGVFECTQRQWELVMGTRPSVFSNPDYYVTRPVENVSYNKIRGITSIDEGWPRYGHVVPDQSFMERLQTRTGLIFDLPTDAQWEYACRAGTTTALNSGKNLRNKYDDDSVNEVGRYRVQSLPSTDCTDITGTAKVGNYLPNAWGLYDMHGNVSEWCLDWYSAVNADPVTDPVGSYTGSARIVRGGDWSLAAMYCRSAYRGDVDPANFNASYGFRIAFLPNSQPQIKCILNTTSGKWCLDDGEWNDTKEKITASVGEHIINYKNIDMPGYVNLPAQTVILETGHIYTRYDNYKQDDSVYVVIDLSAGPDADHYPVRCTNMPPDLDDDACRTTELWLRRIKAGSFIMGSPEDELGRNSDNETQHKVILTQDYFIGVFECTQRQWELVMGTKPSYFNNIDYYSTRPVENINNTIIRGSKDYSIYEHAVDPSSFMGKLQAKTGLKFDLPTEAQWEYACRAGTTTALNSGKNLKLSSEDSNMAEVGRYEYNGGYRSPKNCSTDKGTAKVGSYTPNPWGLYDMHGNVYEKCLDGSSNDETKTVVDPVGAPNLYSLVFEHRGGCFVNEARNCRSADRGNVNLGTDKHYYGFRIVYLP
ncbi:MAG: SUMF1/EgtB/PvdO family nonheme iron enzyme [Lentisphaeria bacterium]|nr:SUMF1/EgtB/PvdO family nonheme iron enzyme [Lentisphaeria bacterium]